MPTLTSARTFWELCAQGTKAILCSADGTAFCVCNARNMKHYPGDEPVVSVAAYNGQLRLYVNQSAQTINHWKMKFGA